MHGGGGLTSQGGGNNQGCTKLVSVVSRIPDKLLMVRQMTLKITTKKVGPNPYHKTTHEKSNLTLINKPRTRSVRHPWNHGHKI